MTERRLDFSAAVTAIENRLIDQDVRFLEEEASSDRDLLKDYEQRQQDELLETIRNKPSAIRSEIVIDPEDLHSIEEKILRVREGLFRHAQHPPYSEWVEMDHARTPEEYGKLFWHEFEDMEVTADAERPSSARALEGYYLLVNADDGSKEVEIDIGFNRTFQLEMGFIDLLDKTKRAMGYRSSRLPLEQMTDEEYTVIDHYLDHYLERTLEPQLEATPK